MSIQDGHIRRLINLAGMLGSDHDGERASAARMATLELRRLGLTWAELIIKAFSALAAPLRQDDPYQDGWEPQRPERRRYSPGRRTGHKEGISLWEFVRHASLQRQHLSAWDISFLNTFLAIGPKCTATEAQWMQVRRIADKLEMAA